MMKIYHHNDADGRCGAAIANRAIFGEKEFIEIDYKDKVDLTKIRADENILIIDFSFKPEIMNPLLIITQNVTWLDHHKTAFEYRYDFPDQLDGIRDINYSGCELAWKYFFPTLQIPKAVELIGDYDKWALKLQPECFDFYEGLKLEDTQPTSSLWDELLNQESSKYFEIITQGKSAIKYRDNYCAKIRYEFGYEVQWEEHKAFATNIYQFGSKGFGEKMQEYEFCISYIHDGKRFTVSLYSIRGIDVSEICKKYGGGGHSGAAGFVCNELPFKKKE